MHPPPDRFRPFLDATARYYRRYDVLAAYVPELIAMHCGHKTSIQLSLPNDDDLGPSLIRLRDFCDRTGFHLARREEPDAIKVLLANRPLPDDEFHDKAKLGELLSYPACCIDHCIGNDLNNPLIDHLGDLIRDGDCFPYWMNLFLQTSPFHLFKHYPCSLTCDVTSAYAQTLLEKIREANPSLWTHLRTFLPGPVLYTDICGAGICLVGKPDTEAHPVGRGAMGSVTVHYRDLFWDANPSQVGPMSRRNTPDDVELFGRLTSLLGQGDQVTLADDACVIRRGTRVMGRLKRPTHLHWKILEFKL